MKVDAGTYQPTVDAAGAAAIQAQADGYDAWWAFETQIDPFLACAIAAERTETVGIGTSIVVAFARNPMTVALQANDVQALSEGRFTLGLGSQIKPHITRRYSMPWSKPAARMREFVLAIRAIWDTWENDTPLEFEGDFYTHTLMAPFFKPRAKPARATRRSCSPAVGPLDDPRRRGEVAQTGSFVHAFLERRSTCQKATAPRRLKRRLSRKAGAATRQRGFRRSPAAGPFFCLPRENPKKEPGPARGSPTY